MIWYALYGI